MHYPGQSHDALKAMTDPAEPGAAQEVADGWGLLGSELSEAAVQLQQAVFGSETGWTGEAADAMRHKLSQVAEWSMTSGDNFTTASSAIADQSSAAESAKQRMPEPVPYDPKQMWDDATPNPFKMAALVWEVPQQREASQQAHNEAIFVVAARDTQMTSSAASVPGFTPPPTLDGGGGTGDDPNPGRTDITGNRDRDGWTGGVSGNQGGGSGVGGTGSGTGTGSGFPGGGGTTGGGATTPGGYQGPSPVGPGLPGGPGPSGPGPTTGPGWFPGGGPGPHG
ncbi:MAG: PPE domain-containing protein, partial [bacterium]